MSLTGKYWGGQAGKVVKKSHETQEAPGEKTVTQPDRRARVNGHPEMAVSQDSLTLQLTSRESKATHPRQEKLQTYLHTNSTQVLTEKLQGDSDTQKPFN